jgi:hypothetical protein
MMIRHLFVLAFLLPHAIPTVFDVLKEEMPLEANNLVQWFEDNYVHGKVR